VAIDEITRRRFLQHGAGATAGLLLLRFDSTALALPELADREHRPMLGRPEWRSHRLGGGQAE
jgi:hypothetical protein